MSNTHEATEPLARAMRDLELARVDTDEARTTEEDEAAAAAVECTQYHLDNVSHWLQELANVLGISLDEAMAGFDPTSEEG